MAVNQRGDVVGYACRNPDVNNDHVQFVGPVYADCYEAAFDLMFHLTRDIVGHTVLIRAT